MIRKQQTSLRMAIIGFGRVVERYYVPALQELDQWQVTAVCDPLIERCQLARTYFPEAQIFDSFENALSGWMPDAVLIAVPPFLQNELVSLVLERGYPVLVEKPMGYRTEDCAVIQEMAKKIHKVVWAGYNRRFHPAYLTLRDKLAGIHPETLRSVNYHLYVDPSKWDSVTSFQDDESRGGGVWYDLVSHQLNLLPWLLQKNPAAVRAEAVDHGAERSSEVSFEIKTNRGKLVQGSAGYSQDSHEVLQITSDRKTWAVCGGKLIATRVSSIQKLRTVCHWHQLPMRFLRRIRKPGRHPTHVSFVRQLESFAESVQGMAPRWKGSAVSDALQTQRLIAACRASIEKGGEWVKV